MKQQTYRTNADYIESMMNVNCNNKLDTLC